LRHQRGSDSSRSQLAFGDDAVQGASPARRSAAAINGVIAGIDMLIGFGLGMGG
jgi:hypothetical protein